MAETSPVLILGTGGGAMEIAHLLLGCGRQVAGFLGPEPDCALPGDWLGDDAELNRVAQGPTVLVLVAVGSPALRRRLSDFAGAAGFPLAGFVHPRAFVAPGVTIGEGAVVYPNATLQSGVTVGRGAVVNANASVGHETAIGAFCSVNPGADIAARVTLGDECYVGIGAAIIERLEIASGTVIGAGATVIRDIPDAGTWVGTPAKRVKD